MIRPSIISSKNNVVVETSQRAILPCRAIGKPKVRHRKSHQYYIYSLPYFRNVTNLNISL